MNEAESNLKKPSKKRKWVRWRFSIRTALVLMTICAIGTMYFQRRVQAIEAVRYLMNLGATVEYHPDSMPFLTESVGDFFRNVKSIEFSQASVADDDLAKLKDLPNLHEISLSSSAIRKEGFEHISKCRQLRALLISGCGRFDDSCVESIKHLNKLNTIDVCKTNLTSVGAEILASGKALRSFTFSCTGRSQVNLLPKPSWYSAEELRSITDHSDLHVTMVGKAYLDNFDDEAIECLKKIDTEQLREFHVRNSKLSSDGISAICSLGTALKRIRFRHCPLRPNDLKEFDITSTSLVLEGTTLNVNDLINLFGSQFITAKLGSTATEFTTYASQFTLSIDDLADQLESDCFRQMPNLTHVDCFCRDNQSFLKAIERSQPSISIYAYLHAEDAYVTFWDAIKATPSLTGLYVHQPPKEICPQFTTEHQLKRLHLYEVPDDPAVLGEKLFLEISKLKLLESLTIRNRLTVGKEISPLTTMAKLNHVEVSSLDDDAASLLLGMKLSGLEVSWTICLLQRSNEFEHVTSRCGQNRFGCRWRQQSANG